MSISIAIRYIYSIIYYSHVLYSYYSYLTTLEIILLVLLRKLLSLIFTPELVSTLRLPREAQQSRAFATSSLQIKILTLYYNGSADQTRDNYQRIRSLISFTIIQVLCLPIHILIEIRGPNRNIKASQIYSSSYLYASRAVADRRLPRLALSKRLSY